MKATPGPSKLAIAVAAALCLFAAGSGANAQNWYYINRQPVTPEVAEQLAARGVPFGYYWQQEDGTWGVDHGSAATANGYRRRPSLSERGLLYSPGELLR